MKAIVITAEIKEKNKKYNLSFVQKNPVGKLIQTNLPSKFFVSEPCSGNYHLRTDLHQQDDWLDVVIPENYNPKLHKLGELYEVNAEKTKNSKKKVAKITSSYATYYLVDKTQAEIEAEQQEITTQRLTAIDNRVNSLTKGAIAILLGLQNLPNEVLETRIELNRVLYNACINTQGNFDAFLEPKRIAYNNEHNETLDLAAYKALVIAKKEAFITNFDNFKLMIEVVRSKWKGLVSDDDKYAEIESILDTLSEQTNPNDLPNIFNQIMTV